MSTVKKSELFGAKWVELVLEFIALELVSVILI
jgi:hypothetical protein